MSNIEKITISLRGIKKLYKVGDQEVAALNGIDLDIKEGEFAALMGPSGSGKSTLMNILGCLDRPSVGSYKLDGQEVAHLSDDMLARTRNQKIGFVFQNFNLLSRISALENVALPLVYAGVDSDEREERAMYFLEQVGLADRADHQPNELSGGQRQRVAIARALVNDPQIIMADEPTGNLDTKSTKEIMEIFQSMHEKGRTIILVTHEPDIAVCASRQLLVRDGVITRDEGKGVVLDVV
ncbi:MAG: ABC transporter ATP-binding protein [Anaerovibrio sp.]|jgi:putative ABC transport system ATP-binding protein|uniref:Macrolide ABC transporter ATP-binding protein n=2 Tax=Anaerovibrio lipolyticus TaxID=82374 RepID=A0A0B2JWP2_9FIRM|nr:MULTISPECIES: ABC transporter ATP-binding protein [Anaerovibrio]KHM52730.1 macrolide ABC transporter ATP-binding protein [Anaerovibrio lipolyticus]MBE6105796.1 ABC transporter ATP-binding protein [Anaerovibrio lipolyticus]MBO5588905.1 ABC transporter ATP-binding protein [Anaerovibrio sp.]MBO6245712.1 ABC transporter ATP-binding protein [Anaerovibrio sp.]MBQ1855493.1 ABC transporter ATP-binding protein [Anaerovibrio sp.]